MIDVEKLKHKLVEKQAILGVACLVIALAILLATFLPLLYQEGRYTYNQSKNALKESFWGSQSVSHEGAQVTNEITPKDSQFGIIIPKIGVNSRIHENVDWQESSVYQKALQTGVAHAEGTSTPDKPGNVFLFAHSGIDFYEALRYNAEFYLVSKLESKDELILYYKDKPYTYKVRESKIVDPDEVNYLLTGNTSPTVTLMTCWPPGTTVKRQLVIADRVEE